MTTAKESGERAMPGDMHYGNGKWQTIDLFADYTEGTSWTNYLGAKGWEIFLQLGDDDSDTWIQTWRREDGDPGFLIRVHDVASASPCVQVDTFPELMDLLAKWAPVIQTAAVVSVLDDLRQYAIRDDGLVEFLAARVRYGAEERYGPMVRVYRR
jgi:hypothetical protein